MTSSPIEQVHDRPDPVKRFAAMVRKAREKRGLSQRVLAQTLKVDVTVLRRLEIGRMTPDLELVAQLTILFRLPLMNAVYGQRVSKLQPDHDPTWNGSQHASEVLDIAEVNAIVGDDDEEGPGDDESS